MTQNTARRRWRTAISIAAGVTAAALVLTGCSSTSSSGGRTTITLAYLWTGHAGGEIQKIVKKFNQSQSSITVKAVETSGTKQLASMSSSNGSFDVSDSFGSSVGTWASKGIIEPLNSYGVDTSGFIPSVLNQDKYKGKLYALPFAVQEYELLYNKDLFSAAGISAPPATMDDFATDIAKLTKVGADGKITQLGLGTSSEYNLLSTLAYVFGGQWDTNGKPSPTNAKNIEALNWYKTNVLDKFGAGNIANFESGYGTYLTAQDPFYTGKLAMIIDGEWQSANIPRTVPSFKWGVAHIPAASPSLENATQTYSSMFFIPANSKHKQQAATFIKYLTGVSAMRSFTLAQGNLPARTSLLTDKAYDSLPGFDVWLKGLTSPNAKAFAATTYASQYQTDLTSAFSNFALGKETADQAMQAVKQQAASYGD